MRVFLAAYYNLRVCSFFIILSFGAQKVTLFQDIFITYLCVSNFHLYVIIQFDSPWIYTLRTWNVRGNLGVLVYTLREYILGIWILIWTRFLKLTTYLDSVGYGLSRFGIVLDFRQVGRGWVLLTFWKVFKDWDLWIRIASYSIVHFLGWCLVWKFMIRGLERDFDVIWGWRLVG